MVKVKVNFSLCITNYLAMKTFWGNRHITPCSFNLGSRWSRVVNFTPWSFYSQGYLVFLILYSGSTCVIQASVHLDKVRLRSDVSTVALMFKL